MKPINILMVLLIAISTSISTYTGEEKKELQVQISLKNDHQLFIEKINPICYVISIKNAKKEEIATAKFAIIDNIHHEQIARICDIQVNPEYRKNKFGSEMVENIVDFAQAKNCKLISLISVNNTQKFYEKLGFTCTKNYSDTTCEMEKNYKNSSYKLL